MKLVEKWGALQESDPLFKGDEQVFVDCKWSMGFKTGSRLFSP